MKNATQSILAAVMVMVCATMAAAPLALDTSALTNDWKEAGISSWRCGAAFKDFGKAVADANAVTVARRAKLGTTARVYLKQQMEKAQAEGDLDKVLVFKTALESARGGEIKGDDEAIVKLRESYEKQLVLADRALLTAGLTAARTLAGTLDWQKTEVTKKGDIADAQKIVAFQKKVEEWANSMQAKSMQIAVAQSEEPKKSFVVDEVVSPASAVPMVSQSNPTGVTSEHHEGVVRNSERGQAHAASSMADAAQQTHQAASAAASKIASRLSDQTLSGMQTELSVSLTKRPQPYIVREQYLVPKGKELIVESGVTIIFEKDASLFCEGALKMNGTEQEPIICKGHMAKVGYWKGITIKSQESTLESVRITHATAGITITTARSLTIANSIFTKNVTGVVFDADGTNKRYSFSNCLISDNSENGIDAGFKFSADFERCSICGNRKHGIRSVRGNMTFRQTVLTDNGQGGMQIRGGDAKAFAHNCVISANKGFDIECEGRDNWLFHHNYWGPSVTRLLQQRGDGANLPNIKDGRDSGRGNLVDVAEFLTEPPKDCGATVKW